MPGYISAILGWTNSLNGVLPSKIHPNKLPATPAPPDMTHTTPVILCGGSGTRLWPLSRTGFPKQFLCLTGHDSLFQQAATRLAQVGSADITVSPPLLVTGEDHRFLAAEQLREAGIALGHALLEPAGRNTAPALTLAALAA